MKMVNVRINIKGITKKKPQIEMQVISLEDSIVNVKQLLEAVVRHSAREYNMRKCKGDILTVLSPEQIEDKAETGKIGFGVNYGDKKVNIPKAVENALQCFADGLVVVFVDGVKKTDLKDVVTLKEGTELTFVKLTMLAGRMW